MATSGPSHWTGIGGLSTLADLRSLLTDIYDRHGKLTKELVLEEATPPESPLHGQFEWRNNVAAHEYRLEQAHRLIQSVRIVYKEDPEAGTKHYIRAWQAVQDPVSKKYEYEPTEKVVRNPELSELVRREMARDWHNLKRRYDTFAEFWAMVKDDIPE